MTPSPPSAPESQAPHRTWRGFGFASVAVTLLAALCGVGCGEDDPPAAAAGEPADAGPPVCTQCGKCEEARPIAGANHVTTTVSYSDIPPSSGDHNPCWAPWGVHDTAVPPERWVHDLEHGGVVLLYHCANGCADALSALTTFTSSHPMTLLTPYPAMPEGFAFVSWGHRLVSSCFDAAALRAFYDAHVDRAPESSASDPPAECAL